MCVGPILLSSTDHKDQAVICSPVSECVCFLHFFSVSHSVFKTDLHFCRTQNSADLVLTPQSAVNSKTSSPLTCRRERL